MKGLHNPWKQVQYHKNCSALQNWQINLEMWLYTFRYKQRLRLDCTETQISLSHTDTLTGCCIVYGYIFKGGHCDLTVLTVLTVLVGGGL